MPFGFYLQNNTSAADFPQAFYLPEPECGLAFLAEKYLPITLLHCDNFWGDAFRVFLCLSSVPLVSERFNPTHMGSVSRN